jgi:hypothetical protein
MESFNVSAIPLPAYRPAATSYVETYVESNQGSRAALNAPGPPADVEVQLAIQGCTNGKNTVIDSYDMPGLCAFDEFDRIKGAGDPFLGPPTASRIAAFFDVSHTYYPKTDTGTALELGFEKPSLKDFVPEVVVGYDIGILSEIPRHTTCVCALPTGTPGLSLCSYLLSTYNYINLFETLKKNGLIIKLHSLLVYKPRKEPCLCSYVGIQYASEFVNYAIGFWNIPASSVLDLPDFIATINQTFADKVLNEINTFQTRKQINLYSKAAGKLAGVQRHPTEERDERIVPLSVKTMGGSDMPDRYGEWWAANPEMGSVHHALSSPSTIFHADLARVTGVNYAKQRENPTEYR